MLKLLILLITFWTIYLKAGVSTQDHQRALRHDEPVIYKLSPYEVISKNSDGTYTIRGKERRSSVVTTLRKNLAVTSGCYLDVCTGELIFDVGYSRMVTVRGIDFIGDYLADTEEGWHGLYKIRRDNLAKMSGCLEVTQGKYCVGQRVKDTAGTRLTIIAIHEDGKLVLKSEDGWNSYRSFVDPNAVTII